MQTPLATSLGQDFFSNKEFPALTSFVIKCKETSQKLFVDNQPLTARERGNALGRDNHLEVPLEIQAQRLKVLRHWFHTPPTNFQPRLCSCFPYFNVFHLTIVIRCPSCVFQVIIALLRKLKCPSLTLCFLIPPKVCCNCPQMHSLSGLIAQMKPTSTVGWEERGVDLLLFASGFVLRKCWILALRKGIKMINLSPNMDHCTHKTVTPCINGD